jgi:hypothetical protein
MWFDLALLVMTWGAVFWIFRWFKKTQIENLRMKHTEMLMDALGVAVSMEKIEPRQASLVLTLWQHFLNADGNIGIDCACGNVRLHCDLDEAEINGFKHTSEFCDIVSEGE